MAGRAFHGAAGDGWAFCVFDAGESVRGKGDGWVGVFGGRGWAGTRCGVVAGPAAVEWRFGGWRVVSGNVSLHMIVRWKNGERRVHDCEKD